MNVRSSFQDLIPSFSFYWLWMLPWTALAQDPTSATPAGYRLMEGDILVRDERFMRAAVVAHTQLWPGGQVPYEFDANVHAVNRKAMRDAMAEWQSTAGVYFVPRSDEDDYVYISNSSLNSSSVGKQGGAQWLNIVSWDNKWIIAHELAHTLGLWHEQSRGDRDCFIRVNLSSVEETNRHNFKIHHESTHYGPYDFDSVMHYGEKDFSINNQTVITVLPPNSETWQKRIGQRNHLSIWDRRVMSFLYPLGDWRFVDQGFNGSPQDGTFLHPFTSFISGQDAVPSGGTLWIQPGSYATGGLISKRMTLQAPLGAVTLNL